MVSTTVRARQILPVFTVLTVLLAGCAGDDQLSESGLAERLDGLCTARDQAVEPLFEHISIGDVPAVATAFEVALPTLRRHVQAVGRLDAPPGARSVVTRYMEEGQRGLVELQAAIHAAQADRQDAYREHLARAHQRLEAAEAVLLEFGARHCGDVPDALEGIEPVTMHVRATEYRFEMEDPIAPAGPVRLVLRNEGQEGHFMALGRLRSGANAADVMTTVARGTSPDDLFEQVYGDTVTIGHGEQATIRADLKPGTYLMLCLAGGPGGTPHAMMGMHLEFEIA